MDERTSVDINSVQLEGSKVTFKRCLSRLLGAHYGEFEEELVATRVGVSFYYWAKLLRITVVEKILKHLAFWKLVTWCRSVTGKRIGAAIQVENADGAKIFVELPPVEYCFDAAKTKRKTIPWDGLVEFDARYDQHDTF